MVVEIPKNTKVLQIDITEVKKQIRAEVIDEFLDKVKELYPNDSNALYKLMCIAGQLKEQK